MASVLSKSQYRGLVDIRNKQVSLKSGSVDLFIFPSANPEERSGTVEDFLLNPDYCLRKKFKFPGALGGHRITCSHILF